MIDEKEVMCRPRQKYNSTEVNGSDFKINKVVKYSDDGYELNTYIFETSRDKFVETKEEQSARRGNETISIVITQKTNVQQKKDQNPKEEENTQRCRKSENGPGPVSSGEYLKILAKNCSAPDVKKAYVNRKQKKKSSCSDTHINKITTIDTKFIVNTVTLEPHTTPPDCQDLLKHPLMQAQMRIYRCQLGSHEEKYCQACNSDAFFDVLKGLYDCYTNKNCVNCNCILCSSFHKARRKLFLGEVSRSKVSVGVETVATKHRTKETLKKTKDHGLFTSFTGKPTEQKETKIAAISKEPLSAQLEKLRKAQASGILPTLEGYSSVQREKTNNALVQSGSPLNGRKKAAESKIIHQVRKELGLPMETRPVLENERDSKSITLGHTTMFEKKSQKETILRAVAEKRMPSREVRPTIDLKKMPLDTRAQSEKMRRARAAGLLMSVESVEYKLIGFPDNEQHETGVGGKTLSERRLIDKIRKELGLTTPITKSALAKNIKPILSPCHMSSPSPVTPEKDKKVYDKKPKEGKGDPGICSVLPSQTNRKTESKTPSPCRITFETVKAAETAGLFSQLQGKSQAEKEKVIKSLANQEIPFPEAKTPSQKKLAKKIRAQLGLPPAPCIKFTQTEKSEKNKAQSLITQAESKSIARKKRNQYNEISRKVKSASVIPPLKEETPEQRALLLRKMKAKGSKFSEERTHSCKSPSQRIKGSVITPEQKSKYEKEKMLRRLAKSGLPLPEGRTASDKELIKRIRTETVLPMETITPSLKKKFSEARTICNRVPLENKLSAQAEDIIKRMSDTRIQLVQCDSRKENKGVRSIKTGTGHVRKTKRIVTQSVAGMNDDRGEKDKIKSTCEMGCGCDKKKIRFKHSYVKIRVTSPDTSSFCSCPHDCPGIRSAAFADNEGIKVTVETATGLPSYSVKPATPLRQTQLQYPVSKYSEEEFHNFIYSQSHISLEISSVESDYTTDYSSSTSIVYIYNSESDVSISDIKRLLRESIDSGDFDDSIQDCRQRDKPVSYIYQSRFAISRADIQRSYNRTAQLMCPVPDSGSGSFYSIETVSSAVTDSNYIRDTLSFLSTLARNLGFSTDSFLVQRSVNEEYYDTEYTESLVKETDLVPVVTLLRNSRYLIDSSEESHEQPNFDEDVAIYRQSLQPFRSKSLKLQQVTERHMAGKKAVMSSTRLTGSSSIFIMVSTSGIDQAYSDQYLETMSKSQSSQNILSKARAWMDTTKMKLSRFDIFNRKRPYLKKNKQKCDEHGIKKSFNACAKAAHKMAIKCQTSAGKMKDQRPSRALSMDTARDRLRYTTTDDGSKVEPSQSKPNVVFEIIQPMIAREKVAQGLIKDAYMKIEYNQIPSSTCYPSDSIVTTGGYMTPAEHSGYSMKPEESSQRENSKYDQDYNNNADSTNWDNLAQYSAEPDMLSPNSEVSLASTIYSSIGTRSRGCVNPALYRAQRRKTKKCSDDCKSQKSVKKKKSCVCEDSLTSSIIKPSTCASKKRSLNKGADSTPSKKKHSRASVDSENDKIINARDSVTYTKNKKHHRKKFSWKRRGKSLDNVQSSYAQKEDSGESTDSRRLKKSYSHDSAQHRCNDRSSIIGSSASRHDKHSTRHHLKSSLRSSSNDSGESGYAKRSHSHDSSRHRHRKKGSLYDSTESRHQKKFSHNDIVQSRNMNKCSYHDSMDSRHSKKCSYHDSMESRNSEKCSYHDSMESRNSEKYSHHDGIQSRYPKKYSYDSSESRHWKRSSPIDSMESRYTQKYSYGSDGSSYPRKGSPAASVKSGHSRKCCSYHDLESHYANKNPPNDDVKIRCTKRYIHDASPNDSVNYGKRSFSHDSLHYNYAKKFSPYDSITSTNIKKSYSHGGTEFSKAKKYSDNNLKADCGKRPIACEKHNHAKKHSPYDSLEASYEDKSFTRHGGQTSTNDDHLKSSCGKQIRDCPKKNLANKYSTYGSAEASYEDKCCVRHGGQTPTSDDNLKSSCGKRIRDCPKQNLTKNHSPYGSVDARYEDKCCIRHGGQTPTSDDHLKSSCGKKIRDCPKQNLAKNHSPYGSVDASYKETCCTRDGWETRHARKYPPCDRVKPSQEEKCCIRHSGQTPTSDDNLKSSCRKKIRDCSKQHHPKKHSPYDSIEASYDETCCTREGGDTRQAKRYPPCDRVKLSQEEKCCIRHGGQTPTSGDNLKSSCGKKVRDCSKQHHPKKNTPYGSAEASYEETCCPRVGGVTRRVKKHPSCDSVKPNQDGKCCFRDEVRPPNSDDNLKSSCGKRAHDCTKPHHEKTSSFDSESSYEITCCTRHAGESHNVSKNSSSKSLKSGGSRKCCSRHEDSRSSKKPPYDENNYSPDGSYMKSPHAKRASQISVRSSAGRCHPCDNPHKKSSHDSVDSCFSQKCCQAKKTYSSDNFESHYPEKIKEHDRKCINHDVGKPCDLRPCCKKKCSHEDIKRLVCKKKCSHHDIGKPCCRKECSHQDMGKCCCQNRCSHHDAGQPCCQKKCSHQDIGKPCCQKKCSHHDTKKPPKKKTSRQDLKKCCHYDIGQPCCYQKCSHQDTGEFCCQRKGSDHDVEQPCCYQKCSHHDVGQPCCYQKCSHRDTGDFCCQRKGSDHDTKKAPKKKNSRQDLKKCSHHDVGQPCCYQKCSHQDTGDFCCQGKCSDHDTKKPPRKKKSRQDLKKCSHHDVGQPCCYQKCSHQDAGEFCCQRKGSNHDTKKPPKKKNSRQDIHKCSHHNAGQPCCHRTCSHEDIGEPCCQKKCSHHDTKKYTPKKKGARNDIDQTCIQKKCSHHDAGQSCCQKKCSHQAIGIPCCQIKCPYHDDDDEPSKKTKRDKKPIVECCYRKKPDSSASVDSCSSQKRTKRDSLDTDAGNVRYTRRPCLPRASCPDVSAEPCDSKTEAVQPCVPKSCLQKKKSFERRKSEEALVSCLCPKKTPKYPKQRKSVFQRLMASMAGTCSKGNLDVDQQSSYNKRSRRDSMSGRDSVTTHKDSMTSTHSFDDSQKPRTKISAQRKMVDRKKEDTGMSRLSKRPVFPIGDGSPRAEKSLSPIKIEPEEEKEPEETKEPEEKKESEEKLDKKDSDTTKETKKKEKEKKEKKEKENKVKEKREKKLKAKKEWRSDCQCPITDILNTEEKKNIAKLEEETSRKCRRDCLTKEQNAMLHVLKRVSEYFKTTASLADCDCNPEVSHRETKRKTSCECYPHVPRPKEDNEEERKEIDGSRRTSAEHKRHTQTRERDEEDGCRRPSCVARKCNPHANYNKHTPHPEEKNKEKPCARRHTDCKNYMRTRKTKNENEVVTKVTDLTKKTSPCLCNSALFEKMLNKVMKEACFSPPAPCGRPHPQTPGKEKSNRDNEEPIAVKESPKPVEKPSTPVQEPIPAPAATQEASNQPVESSPTLSPEELRNQEVEVEKSPDLVPQQPAPETSPGAPDVIPEQQPKVVVSHSSVILSQHYPNPAPKPSSYNLSRQRSNPNLGLFPMQAPDKTPNYYQQNPMGVPEPTAGRITQQNLNVPLHRTVDQVTRQSFNVPAEPTGTRLTQRKYNAALGTSPGYIPQDLPSALRMTQRLTNTAQQTRIAHVFQNFPNNISHHHFAVFSRHPNRNQSPSDSAPVHQSRTNRCKCKQCGKISQTNISSPSEHRGRRNINNLDTQQKRDNFTYTFSCSACDPVVAYNNSTTVRPRTLNSTQLDNVSCSACDPNVRNINVPCLDSICSWNNMPCNAVHGNSHPSGPTQSTTNVPPNVPNTYSKLCSCKYTHSDKTAKTSLPGQSCLVAQECIQVSNIDSVCGCKSADTKCFNPNNICAPTNICSCKFTQIEEEDKGCDSCLQEAIKKINNYDPNAENRTFPGKGIGCTNLPSKNPPVVPRQYSQVVPSYNAPVVHGPGSRDIPKMNKSIDNVCKCEQPNNTGRTGNVKASPMDPNTRKGCGNSCTACKCDRLESNNRPGSIIRPENCLTEKPRRCSPCNPNDKSTMAAGPPNLSLAQIAKNLPRTASGTVICVDRKLCDRLLRPCLCGVDACNCYIPNYPIRRTTNTRCITKNQQGQTCGARAPVGRCLQREQRKCPLSPLCGQPQLAGLEGGCFIKPETHILTVGPGQMLGPEGHNQNLGDAGELFQNPPNYQQISPQGQMEEPIYQPIGPQGQMRQSNYQPMGPQGHVEEPNYQPMGPQGQIRQSNYQPMSPQGQMEEPNYQPTGPQGQIRQSNYQPMGPQGQMEEPNYQPMGPQGQIRHSNYQPMGPQGQMEEPNYQLMAPQGQMRQPNYQPMGPQGQMEEPNYQPMGPQGQIRQSNYQLMGPQEQMENPDQEMWGPQAQQQAGQEPNYDMMDSQGQNPNMQQEMTGLDENAMQNPDVGPEGQYNGRQSAMMGPGERISGAEGQNINQQQQQQLNRFYQLDPAFQGLIKTSYDQMLNPQGHIVRMHPQTLNSGQMLQNRPVSQKQLNNALQRQMPYPQQIIMKGPSGQRILNLQGPLRSGILNRTNESFNLITGAQGQHLSPHQQMVRPQGQKIQNLTQQRENEAPERGDNVKQSFQENAGLDLPAETVNTSQQLEGNMNPPQEQKPECTCQTKLSCFNQKVWEKVSEPCPCGPDPGPLVVLERSEKTKCSDVILQIKSFFKSKLKKGEGKQSKNEKTQVRPDSKKEDKKSKKTKKKKFLNKNENETDGEKTQENVGEKIDKESSSPTVQIIYGPQGHILGRYPDHISGVFPDHVAGGYNDHLVGDYTDPLARGYIGHMEGGYPDQMGGGYANQMDGSYPGQMEEIYPDQMEEGYLDQITEPRGKMHGTYYSLNPLDAIIYGPEGKMIGSSVGTMTQVSQDQLRSRYNLLLDPQEQTASQQWPSRKGSQGQVMYPTRGNVADYPSGQSSYYRWLGSQGQMDCQRSYSGGRIIPGGHASRICQEDVARKCQGQSRCSSYDRKARSRLQLPLYTSDQATGGSSRRFDENSWNNISASCTCRPTEDAQMPCQGTQYYQYLAGPMATGHQTRYMKGTQEHILYDSRGDVESRQRRSDRNRESSQEHLNRDIYQQEVTRRVSYAANTYDIHPTLSGRSTLATKESRIPSPEALNASPEMRRAPLIRASQARPKGPKTTVSRGTLVYPMDRIPPSPGGSPMRPRLSSAGGFPMGLRPQAQPMGPRTTLSRGSSVYPIDRRPPLPGGSPMAPGLSSVGGFPMGTRPQAQPMAPRTTLSRGSSAYPIDRRPPSPGGFPMGPKSSSVGGSLMGPRQSSLSGSPMGYRQQTQPMSPRTTLSRSSLGYPIDRRTLSPGGSPMGPRSSSAGGSLIGPRPSSLDGFPMGPRQQAQPMSPKTSRSSLIYPVESKPPSPGGSPMGPRPQAQPMGPRPPGQPMGPGPQGQPMGPRPQGQPMGPRPQGQPMGPRLQGQPMGPKLQGQPMGAGTPPKPKGNKDQSSDDSYNKVNDPIMVQYRADKKKLESEALRTLLMKAAKRGGCRKEMCCSWHDLRKVCLKELSAIKSDLARSTSGFQLSQTKRPLLFCTSDSSYDSSEYSSEANAECSRVKPKADDDGKSSIKNKFKKGLFKKKKTGKDGSKDKSKDKSKKNLTTSDSDKTVEQDQVTVEQNQVIVVEDDTFKGLKFYLEGKGGDSPGLSGVFCFKSI